MRDGSWLGARRRASSAFAALAVIGCAACSLLFDVSRDQCESASDCAKFGQSFTCLDHTCITSDVKPDGSTDAPVEPRCESNAKCSEANFGEPYVCDKVSGACLSVKSNGACAFVTPSDELKNDNAVLVGAFIPLHEVTAPLAQPIALAYQLALGEIQKAGGLPGGIGAPRRPLVAVLCDSDPGFVEDGVKHLTQTLKVPAIVSLFSQTDMTRFFQDYLGPTNTFTLNPQDATEALRGINANRLLWHLLGTPEDIALAYRPFVERVERYSKSKFGTTTTRVALVTSETPFEESISSVVRDSVSNTGIRFNEKTTAGNGANFLAIKVPSLEKDPTVTFGSVVDQLVAFAPTIVIALTSQEAGAIIPALDVRLAGDGGSGAPLYVLSSRNARVPGLLNYLSNAVAEPSDEKRKRFFGIQWASAANKTQYNRFLERFGEQNPLVPRTDYLSIENYYDAMYWLAYGLFAAGPGAPLQGQTFADGVRKLLSGPPINPGTVSDISTAFQTLTNSATGATFEGALGTPDFDIATGMQRSVGAAYCYVREEGVITPRYDVLRYSRASGQLTGDFDCFLGFPSSD